MTMPNMMEKIPPHNIEAEQAALGAMLLERTAIERAVDLLRAEDFYREAHRTIFQGIIDLYGKNEPVDLITLGDLLKTKPASVRDPDSGSQLKAIGGTLYLTTVMNQVPTAAGIAHYAGIIRTKAVQRQLIKSADEIMNAAYLGDQELDELVDMSEQKIFAVAERTVTNSFVPLQQVIKKEFYTIEEMRESGGAAAGVSTGYTELDGITAGLHDTDLVIVAARPSMGKTALALNIARNVALNERKSVALFSLEMSKEQLAQRLLCTEARVSMDVVRHAQVSDEEMAALAAGVERLWDVPIYIDDSPMTHVMEMRGKCRRLKADTDLGLIVVDYLQLMSSPGRVENRVQEIAQIARGLKALAREMKVPVMALSQLSRSVESRSPRRPQLSDLRESGAIEQDADLVMFLYRPAYYGDEEINKVGLAPDEHNLTEVLVAKQRNGPTGVIHLAWLGDHGLFTDAKKRHYSGGD
ncbi:MAG: replicative DNA helicase, partial [bacterium]